MSTLYTLIQVPGGTRYRALRRRTTSLTLDQPFDQRRRFGYSNTTVWYTARLAPKFDINCVAKKGHSDHIDTTVWSVTGSLGMMVCRPVWDTLAAIMTDRAFCGLGSTIQASVSRTSLL
jgi:hypothetical protein